MIEYRINAEILVRLARDILGIKKWEYKIYLLPHRYIFQISNSIDSVYFQIDEFQVDVEPLPEPYLIELDVDFIYELSKEKLKNFSADIRLEIDLSNLMAKLYYPEYVLKFELQLVKLTSVPDLSNPNRDHASLFNKLIRFLYVQDNRVVALDLRSCGMYALNKDNTTFSFLPNLTDSVEFETEDARFLYAILSRLKKCSVEFNSWGISIQFTIGGRGEKISVLAWYCSIVRVSKKNLISKLISSINRVITDGIKLNITENKVTRAIQFVERDSLDADDLIPLTNATKISVKDFLFYFRDVTDLQGAWVINDRLLVQKEVTYLTTTHIKVNDGSNKSRKTSDKK